MKKKNGIIIFKKYNQLNWFMKDKKKMQLNVFIFIVICINTKINPFLPRIKK
jgi:hypothetical protein